MWAISFIVILIINSSLTNANGWTGFTNAFRKSGDNNIDATFHQLTDTQKYFDSIQTWDNSMKQKALHDAIKGSDTVTLELLLRSGVRPNFASLIRKAPSLDTVVVLAAYGRGNGIKEAFDRVISDPKYLDLLLSKTASLARREEQVAKVAESHFFDALKKGYVSNVKVFLNHFDYLKGPPVKAKVHMDKGYQILEKAMIDASPILKSDISLFRLFYSYMDLNYNDPMLLGSIWKMDTGMKNALLQKAAMTGDSKVFYYITKKLAREPGVDVDLAIDIAKRHGYRRVVESMNL